MNDDNDMMMFFEQAATLNPDIRRPSSDEWRNEFEELAEKQRRKVAHIKRMLRYLYPNEA